MDIEKEDLLYFIDGALDGMTSIVTELGDELANQAPKLANANTPYAILTHCLGVMAFWGRQVVSGDDVHRDRPAEFTARGQVEALAGRVEIAKTELRRALSNVSLAADAASPEAASERPARPRLGPPRPTFKISTAVVHILEELAQHHGQMEITRDLLKQTRTIE